MDLTTDSYFLMVSIMKKKSDSSLSVITIITRRIVMWNNLIRKTSQSTVSPVVTASTTNLADACTMPHVQALVPNNGTLLGL